MTAKKSPFYQSPLPPHTDREFWAQELFLTFANEDFQCYSNAIKLITCERIAKEIATGTRTECMTTSEWLSRGLDAAESEAPDA